MVAAESARAAPHQNRDFVKMSKPLSIYTAFWRKNSDLLAVVEDEHEWKKGWKEGIKLKVKNGWRS